MYFYYYFYPQNNDRLKISKQSYSYNYISVTQLTTPATILTRELGEPVITSYHLCHLFVKGDKNICDAETVRL